MAFLTPLINNDIYKTMIYLFIFIVSFGILFVLACTALWSTEVLNVL